MTGLVSSVGRATLALIESGKDYSGKSKSIYYSAIDISSAQRELELELGSDCEQKTLIEFQKRFDAIVRDHGVNHDEIDYSYVLLTDVCRKAEGKFKEWRRTQA